MNLEAEMAAGIESDSAPDAELETREVDIRTAGNMCGTHAGHYERLAHDGRLPRRIVAEVSMKLIKNHVLAKRLGRRVWL